MQLLVGCKVEGNLCWNCKYIAKCFPSTRPQCDCAGYAPLGRYITHQHIADWLNIERHQLGYVLKKFGADKVVELLEIRGHIVRYETVMGRIRFYLLGEVK